MLQDAKTNILTIKVVENNEGVEWTKQNEYHGITQNHLSLTTIELDNVTM